MHASKPNANTPASRISYGRKAGERSSHNKEAVARLLSLTDDANNGLATAQTAPAPVQRTHTLPHPPIDGSPISTLLSMTCRSCVLCRGWAFQAFWTREGFGCEMMGLVGGGWMAVEAFHRLQALVPPPSPPSSIHPPTHSLASFFSLLPTQHRGQQQPPPHTTAAWPGCRQSHHSESTRIRNRSRAVRRL